MSKLKKYKLDKLYKISSGISTKPEQYGKGSPFVSFSTIFNNYFLPDELPELMETSEQEQKTYSVKKGDVFLTRTSETLDELAMSSVAIKDYPKATFSGFAKRLRPIQEDITYDKYMGFFLRSKYFRKIIDNNAIMTLRASFNEAIFSYINIYLPDYNQQVKIGNLLYKIEEKIKLNNKINAELENIAKDLYDYWFVQFNFPDENGSPYKSSGGKMKYCKELKQKIPQDWTVDILSSLTEIKSGYAFNSNDYVNDSYYRLITIKNVQDNFISSNVDNCIKQIPTNMPNYCLLKQKDILLSLTGNIGRVGMVFENNLLLNQRVGLLKLKDKKYHSYIYLLFLNKMFKTRLEKISTGSNQKNLSPIDAEKLPILVPINILDKFNQLTTPLIDDLINNFIENKQLTELRDFLLPMLINCQVNISNKIEDNLSEEKIIEKSLEFWKTHGKMDIDKFARENGILVCKDNEQKKGAVSYNAEKDLYEIAVKDPRDNFTIAHEIGHILKHKKELKTGTLGRKSEESGSKIMEYEADFLAAEILMPEEYVLQYMQNENKTDKEFLDEKFIKSCAKKFDVTPPAMNIRLKNLGYKVPYLK